MKYEFNHSNYSNFAVYEDNKLPPRSYLIPFSTLKDLKATTYLNERYKSDMVSMLSGEWQFLYYDKVSKMPKDFDTSVLNFDVISVPSCWQFTNYEEPFYLNSRYQFKPNPPVIPTDIPIGVYRKVVQIDSVANQEIITFLGAAACIELYVNGNYVGYSEGSHNTAEFNITESLINGENEIIALVYKFCNGSYIEAQDMFRNNGIFRDVYITHYGQSMLYDLSVETACNSGIYSVSFNTKVRGVACDLKLSVMYGDELKAVIESKSDIEDSITIDNPHEWSAEIPNLYTVYAELVKDGKVTECVRQEFGLKHIDINDNVFLLNNRKIKLLGVNHHDTDESKGYVMNAADIIRDVEIFKQYNVNAVRTSHYPPDPIFIKACSHYGVYVIDEADIEAHGVGAVGRPNWVSANRAWKHHYWDRVKRMYERDKNNVSVVMWSLGNEAGGIACQDYCYYNLKALTNTPIHYEGACRSRRYGYDVISHMYYPIRLCERVADKTAAAKRLNKPFFLCEYAHAMGVGPGDLDKYVDIFLSADNMLGGCIWEFCDHAVKHDKGSKYKYEYTYGGDHGEFIHDSNFCVDGLFYPDRTPNSGAIAMKNVYRPLRAANVGKGKYSITNTNYFRDSAYITIEYKVLVDGAAVESAKIDNMTIKPQESAIVDIATDKYAGCDIFVTFVYTDKNSGKLIAQEQCVVNEVLPRVEPIVADGLVKIDKDNAIGYSYGGGEILFDKTKGAMLSYVANGVQLLNGNPYREDGLNGLIPTVYRAAIDNYMNIDKVWRKQGLDKAEVTLTNYESRANVITMMYVIKAKGRKAINAQVKYKVGDNGAVDVNIAFATPLFKSYDVPKLGVNIELAKEFDNIEYYGRGSEECYNDFNKQSVVATYEAKVEDLFNNYIKPQDNGNHTDIRYVSFTDSSGKGIKFTAVGKALNFSASRYTLDNMRDAKHREDITPRDMTAVNIDGFVRGAGSNSCGPVARKMFTHKLDGNGYNYSFRMEPIAKKITKTK